MTLQTRCVLKNQSLRSLTAELGFAQVSPNEALVGLAQAGVLKAAQLSGNPIVGLIPGRSCDVKGLGTFEEGADLLQRLEPLGLECHDHPPMVPNSDRFQAHFTLELRAYFRLICHWKRLLLAFYPPLSKTI